eukprot:TRINITY_DN17380_c0_g1_i4.p1 TRINITY_DN17380_c0_g1~~TRINITY_DN17380_c0_g1_i4.p1  ORF type:complete len:385 (+),score=80.92 TRINITY_DN17380_c0_g1_i4:46-1200(+)
MASTPPEQGKWLSATLVQKRPYGALCQKNSDDNDSPSKGTPSTQDDCDYYAINRRSSSASEHYSSTAAGSQDEAQKVCDTDSEGGEQEVSKNMRERSYEIWAEVQTVQMHGLPPGCMELDVEQFLCNAGFQGCVNFLQVPIDPATGHNVGYALINFMRPNDAKAFRSYCEGNTCTNGRNNFTVIPALVQGFEASFSPSHSHYGQRSGPAYHTSMVPQPSPLPPPAREQHRGALVAGSQQQQYCQQQQQQQQQSPLPPQQPAGTAAASWGRQTDFSSPAPPPATPKRFCGWCGSQRRGTTSFNCSSCGQLLDGGGGSYCNSVEVAAPMAQSWSQALAAMPSCASSHRAPELPAAAPAPPTRNAWTYPAYSQCWEGQGAMKLRAVR